MQITVTVENFNELLDLARTLTAQQTPTVKPDTMAAPEPVKEPDPVPAAPAPAPVAAAALAPAPAAKPDIPKLKQEVQTKAIALMDLGKQDQLQALLKKYSVPALPMLADDQLAPFMADMEAL